MSDQKIKIKGRIRYWNIAVGLLILAAIFFAIAPFIWQSLKTEFAGNVISEIWGITIGAIVATVFFQQFKNERFKLLLDPSYNLHFTAMRDLSQKLIPYALDNATNAKLAVSNSLRSELKECADWFLERAIFYQKFMELEELLKFEKSYKAAKTLSGIDHELTDAEFMDRFVFNTLMMYLMSAKLGGLDEDQGVVDKLKKASEYWAKQAFSASRHVTL